MLFVCVYVKCLGVDFVLVVVEVGDCVIICGDVDVYVEWVGVVMVLWMDVGLL